MKFNILLLTLTFFAACTSSEKNHIITEEEILQRLSAVDPKVRLLPDNPSVVGCQNYAGCKKFTRATFGNLEIFVVEMQSERIAQEYAQKKEVLYIGNWLFDNIQREPHVKKLVQKAIEIDLSTIKPAEEKKEDGGGHH